MGAVHKGGILEAYEHAFLGNRISELSSGPLSQRLGHRRPEVQPQPGSSRSRVESRWGPRPYGFWSETKSCASSLIPEVDHASSSYEVSSRREQDLPTYFPQSGVCAPLRAPGVARFMYCPPCHGLPTAAERPDPGTAAGTECGRAEYG